VPGGRLYTVCITCGLAVILLGFGVSYILHTYFHIEGDWRTTASVLIAVLSVIYIAYELLSRDGRSSIAKGQ